MGNIKGEKMARNLKAERFVSLFGTMLSTDVNGRFEIGYVGGSNRLTDDTVDHYFFPNIGGTKEKDIRQLTTLFIDLDVGRGTDKKYLPLRQVKTRKVQMLKKVDEFVKQFDLPPTYVIETRNGYQLYWRFAARVAVNSLTMKKWKDCEKRLFSFFKDAGADAKVLKPNQILRVPYTTWNKKKEGMQPFYCSVVRESKNTYNLDGMFLILSSIPLAPVTGSAYSQDNAKYKKSSNKTVGVGWPMSGKYDVQTPKNLSDQPISKNDSANLIAEVVDFLREIAPQFKYQNKLYTERTALRLADELMKLKV